MIDEQIKEFERYSKTYDLSNPDIMRKFHHTFRVVEYAKDIARSENLPEKDVKLAMLCALLHDISRYRQITLYKTYNDALSFDHGEESYKILVTNSYIYKYTKDKEEQEIVLKAVKNHNKYEVDTTLSERELLFTKILRDADKLDIMMEQGNTINGVIVLNALYIRPFQEQRQYRNDKVTGEYEVTLRSLAFVYDMNFKYTFEFVRDSGIIDKKIYLLESHSSSLGIIEYLKKILLEYVEQRIEGFSK